MGTLKIHLCPSRIGQLLKASWLCWTEGVASLRCSLMTGGHLLLLILKCFYSYIEVNVTLNKIVHYRIIFICSTNALTSQTGLLLMLPLIKYQISVIINHLLRWSVLLELLMMEQILALKRQQPHTHLVQVDSHEFVSCTIIWCILFSLSKFSILLFSNGAKLLK